MEEETKKGFEIVSDLSETGLDQAFADGLLRDIPFIGTAYKIAMLGKSISDRIFVTKLARFLQEIESIPKEELVEFCRKIDGGKVSLRRLGEAVVLAINRIDDMDKLSILGSIFRAYLGSKITYDQFRRIYAAIDFAVLSDLKSFCDPLKTENDRTFSHLMNSGLTAVSPSAVDEHGRAVFLRVEKTELGKIFQELMSQNMTGDRTNNSKENKW